MNKNININMHISTLHNVINFTGGNIKLQMREDTKEPS